MEGVEAPRGVGVGERSGEGTSVPPKNFLVLLVENTVF